MPKNQTDQLIFAKSISEFGNALRMIALPLGMLRISGSPKSIAIAEILEAFAGVIAGLIIPFFIDRFPKRNSLVISDILSLITTLAMAAGVYYASITLLIFASALMAATYVLHDTALSATTADIDVTGNTASIIRGFSRLQFWTIVIGMLGAFSGSKWVQHIPLWSFFLIDAISFVLSSAWILKLIPKKESESPTKKENQTFKRYFDTILVEWKEGFQYCYKHPNIKSLIISQSLVAISYGLLNASIIGHYKTTLKVTDASVGHAQLNNRFWQVLGAFFRVRIQSTPQKTLLFGTSLMVIGFFGMAFVPFVALLGFYGLQQFGNSFVTPTNRALIMSFSDEKIRGRVASFRGLMIDAGLLVGSSGALLILSFSYSSWCFVVAGIFAMGSLGITIRERKV